MAEGLNVDAQAVARRCTVKSPEYDQLTPLDWVVLDFTDGLRTFSSLLSLIPTTKSDLAASFIHLRLLGLLTWNAPSQTDPRFTQSRVGARNGASQVGGRSQAGVSQGMHQAQKTGGVSNPSNSVVSAMPGAPSAFTDDMCAQYLPPRLFSTFRAFQPELADSSLELSLEIQFVTEFLHNNLSSLSPYDLLGLTEGQCTKADVKQAYLLRTKQFHPDRYFRKNIGPFTPRIAAIFKAVTGAFTNLQSKVK